MNGAADLVKSSRNLLLAMSIVAQLACHRSNSNFCAEPNGDSCPCATSDDCDGEYRNVCDPHSRLCVECTESEIDACTAGLPACANHTCSPCTEHVQCGAISGVCLPEGMCGIASEISYVAPNGVAGAECTKEAPCTVATALDTGRPYVMFTGTIAEGVTVDAGQVVTFLAEPGAKLTRSDSGSIITVKDDQTSLAIYDLEVANAPSGVGVLVSFDSGAPTISLVRTKVRNNSSGGLFVNGGTVTVSDSEFSENGGSGMFMSSAATAVVTKSVFRRNKENGYREDSSTTTLTENLFLENAAMGVVLETTRATVRRNTVLQNMQGGVRIGNRSMFEVTDNFVIYNGRALGPTTSGAGGVIISVTLDGRFERNTIAFNESTGAARAGIQCAGSLVSAGANLVYHNTEADGAGGTKTDASTQVNTTSDCQFGNTLSLATHETHLGFRSPLNAPFDFHLTMATPRVVVDSAGPCTGADFDGEPRPRGDACDMGADELAP